MKFRSFSIQPSCSVVRRFSFSRSFCLYTALRSVSRHFFRSVFFVTILGRVISVVVVIANFPSLSFFLLVFLFSARSPSSTNKAFFSSIRGTTWAYYTKARMNKTNVLFKSDIDFLYCCRRGCHRSVCLVVYAKHAGWRKYYEGTLPLLLLLFFFSYRSRVLGAFQLH